jgi:hypothetical protein
VSTVLSLLAFAAYVVVIVGLAAGITWAVVKLTPPGKKSKPESPAGS